MRRVLIVLGLVVAVALVAPEWAHARRHHHHHHHHQHRPPSTVVVAPWPAFVAPFAVSPFALIAPQPRWVWVPNGWQ